MFPGVCRCCPSGRTLNEALDIGISLYAGEAEGRFDEVLRDAAAGKLKPIYNYLHDLPGLEGATGPYMPPERVGRTIGMISSFDAGRGCPFLCSFCTIINVQGRKSRYRTADDIEALVRVNHANGVALLFITDDNLARNRNWEINLRPADRAQTGGHLLALHHPGRYGVPQDFPFHREGGGGRRQAGVYRPREHRSRNLAAAKKKQNHIADYREILLEWRKHRCITYCGYIIGFPNDTPQSLVQRIQIIQRELPLDILEFSILTPLPGSEDHAKAVAKGVDIDPDLNKFDLEHVTTDHPRMSREEWQEAYRLAWRTYYTEDHIKTVIRRAVAGGPRPDTVAYLLTWFWASFHFYNIYPLETGMIRRRYRRDRRPGLPLENPLLFYARHWGGQVITYGRILAMFAKVHLMVRRMERDPNAKAYTDASLQSSTKDFDSLEMFQLSNSARAAGAKAKKLEGAITRRLKRGWRPPSSGGLLAPVWRSAFASPMGYEPSGDPNARVLRRLCEAGGLEGRLASVLQGASSCREGGRSGAREGFRPHVRS